MAVAKGRVVTGVGVVAEGGVIIEGGVVVEGGVMAEEGRINDGVDDEGGDGGALRALWMS